MLILVGIGVSELGPLLRYVGDRSQLARLLAEEAEPGDCVIALGAGDVNKVLKDVEALILAKHPAPGPGKTGGGP